MFPCGGFACLDTLLIRDANKCILTGSDAEQEWLLPWWLGHLLPNLPAGFPIVIADFGISPKMRDRLSRWAGLNLQFLPVAVIPGKSPWFLKPKAMLQSSYEYTCWIDADCQVLKPVHDIFAYAVDGKLGMSKDPYAQKNGWSRYQSGVTVFKNKPKILEDWVKRSLLGIERGDQEALHKITGNDDSCFNVLPDEFNWLRLDLKYRGMNPDARIIHWTGPRGKRIIKDMIRFPGEHPLGSVFE